MNYFIKYNDQISQLCKKHKVKTLYAFGSVLTEQFNKQSDIDLIVDFKKIPIEDYIENYYNFKFSLQSALKREIDLLEDTAIKNPFFRRVVTEQKQLIYG